MFSIFFSSFFLISNARNCWQYCCSVYSVVRRQTCIRLVPASLRHNQRGNNVYPMWYMDALLFLCLILMLRYHFIFDKYKCECNFVLSECETVKFARNNIRNQPTHIYMLQSACTFNASTEITIITLYELWILCDFLLAVCCHCCRLFSYLLTIL